MKKILIPLLLALAAASCSQSHTLKDGEYSFDLLTTNDIHGRYFDSLYVGNNTKESLLAVNSMVNQWRDSLGEKNVILLDAGDCLQGDNASYYYNYVDTKSKHLYAKMAEYMKYDAIVVGNHDVETGHPVYDRIDKTMNIPFLAANAVSESSEKPYFQEYTILKKGGLRVAVIGFTNANIKGWLAEDIWKGIDFLSLMPYAQEEVDKVLAKEKPDAVIVAVHSGTGRGDGNSIESQGLDLLYSLHGVDFVIASHDHRAYTESHDHATLINAGSHCRDLGHGRLTLKVEGGKIVSRSTSGELLKVDKTNVDQKMRETFRPEYEAVKAFTVKKVGELDMPLKTRESFIGMCDYINLIHRVSLGCAPAQLSMAAPLSYNGYVPKGDVLYNDLFTIYTYENQLFVVKMSGQQVKDYLEYSYDAWINTISSPEETLLKIFQRDDPRTGQKGWSFSGRTYNFDSLGGAFYTVDVTKPRGERVSISALSDGTPFDYSAQYNVAMTSYRASGGGYLMSEGAGIDTSNIEELVVEKFPEIRELIYQYFTSHNGAAVTSAELSDPSVVGHWEFTPTQIAGPALERDYVRLFPRR